MNLEYRQYLPAGFSPGSRVWVYQSNRQFAIGEALKLEELLRGFAGGWLSHGEQVKAEARLFFGQFIILLADESQTGVSGCSTDSSVQFIKHIEKEFGVNLFDRLSLAFVIREKIQLLPLAQMDYALEHNFINAETLYFNNTVQTMEALEKNWIIPVQESWLAKKIIKPLYSGK